MSILSPREQKTQYFALTYFLAGCCGVALLQFTVGLHFTSHYFVAHFMLGLFLPFFFYSLGANSLSFWIGISLTSVLHFGYEFCEDQLNRSQYSPDWDQITSGVAGLMVAYLVYRLWNKKLDRDSNE